MIANGHRDTLEPVTVLMYHAVAGEAKPPIAADPHYTVTEAAFVDQIQEMRIRGMRPSSVRDLLHIGMRAHAVGVTFDDGDASNRRAAEILTLEGGTADFFVNPGTVGQAGFLTWAELRGMADAGHSIQSHGQTHRYFDELHDTEARRELRESKAAIEDRIGHAVTLFAPPGGRMSPRTASIAREAGYEAICCSQAGVWREGCSPWRIPRLAVTHGIDLRRFERWIAQDGWELARMQLRHAVLYGAKQVLGNQRYERVRETLLGAAERAPGP